MDRKSKHVELIIWGDAYSEDAWLEKEEAGTDHHVVTESIGFLVRETKKSVTLCLNYQPDTNQVSCNMTIPKGMILKRIKMQIPKK
jgi:hypothetical protein